MKGFIPEMRSFKRKEKKVPFYFVRGQHQLSWSCVWTFVCKWWTDGELKMKDVGISVGWSEAVHPLNKLLSTGEAGWSGLPPQTLQYSKTAHRIKHRIFCLVIFFNLFLWVFFFFSFWVFTFTAEGYLNCFQKTCWQTSSSDWPIAASLVYSSGYRRLKNI